MRKTKNRFLPILSAILLGGIFALLIVVARELNQTLSIQEQVYSRSLVALLIVLIIYRKYFGPKKLKTIPKKDINLAILRGIILYLGAISLVSYAAINSTVFLTSVLAVLPFAAVFGVIFFNEKFTKTRQLSLFLAFIGVVIMNNPFETSLQFGKGELAAILSAFLFSAAYVMRRLHSEKINNAQMSSLMFLSGTTSLLFTSAFLGQGIINKEQLTANIITWVLIGGVLNVANIMLVNYVFSNLPAVTANVLLTSEFVFALLIGIVFYEEIPILLEIIGTILIVGSIIFLSLSENRHKKLQKLNFSYKGSL